MHNCKVSSLINIYVHIKIVYLQSSIVLLCCCEINFPSLADVLWAGLLRTSRTTHPSPQWHWISRQSWSPLAPPAEILSSCLHLQSPAPSRLCLCLAWFILQHCKAWYRQQGPWGLPACKSWSTNHLNLGAAKHAGFELLTAPASQSVRTWFSFRAQILGGFVWCLRDCGNGSFGHISGLYLDSPNGWARPLEHAHLFKRFMGDIYADILQLVGGWKSAPQVYSCTVA